MKVIRRPYTASIHMDKGDGHPLCRARPGRGEPLPVTPIPAVVTCLRCGHTMHNLGVDRMEWKKYRVRDTVVDAMRLNVKVPRFHWPDFIIQWSRKDAAPDGSWGVVDTPSGRRPIHDGDWIVKFAEGAYQVFTDDAFNLTFKPETAV